MSERVVRTPRAPSDTLVKQGRMPVESGWDVELDRLEVELLWAERVLKIMVPLDPSGWTSPAELSPLPDRLVERARTLQARQQQVMQQIAMEMGQILRARHFTGTAEPGPEKPRFLDLAG